MRELPRNYLVVRIPIYDVDNLGEEGYVVDLTERGVQAEGIAAEVDQFMTLLVQPGDYANVSPFSFEAQCRWLKGGSNDNHRIAGFEITNISDKSLHELRKLIRLLTLADAE